MYSKQSVTCVPGEAKLDKFNVDSFRKNNINLKVSNAFAVPNSSKVCIRVYIQK